MVGTTLAVQALVDAASLGLGLTVAGGRAGLRREIRSPRIQKPGLALAGFTEQVHADRVQALGLTELSYVGQLEPSAAARGAEALFGCQPSCVIVMRGLEPLPVLLEAAERHQVALLRTPLTSSVFMERLGRFLEDQLAPTASLHGVLIDVLGVGILLLGKSGIGKSEAALDLVLRGHRLVADDVVDVRRRHAETVYGSGSEIIRHHMEIRGLGIINVKDLFGVAAVRDRKKIELVVELTEWREEEEYDRLGVEELSFAILDVQVPMLRIPVRPGRNITSIIEVAARNQLLKVRGHHSARAFQDRINRAISDADPALVDRDEVE